MIFMPVRYDKAFDLISVCSEVAEIRQYNIYAVHAFIRETHAAVNNDYITAEFIHGHVLADLAETAKRDDS